MARYDKRAREKRSVLCVGIDPTAKHIPPKFGFGSASNLANWWAYLKLVIELAAQYAAQVKPQSAFYEAVMRLGGMELLYKVVCYAHELGLLATIDAKRQDIGNTDEHYALWIFGDCDGDGDNWMVTGLDGYNGFEFDACTRNIYLGPTFWPNDKEQNWWPYMQKGKMPILMCRTSNGEAPWLQDLSLSRNQPDGRIVDPNFSLVYQWVAGEIQRLDAEAAERSGGVACIGAVVGATYPQEAMICRQLAPDVFFLIPGYGAQGGGAAGAVAGFPNDGRLLGTVNSSRGITTAWADKNGDPKPGDPLMHVEAAIVDANNELNEALEAKLGLDPYGALAA